MTSRSVGLPAALAPWSTTLRLLDPDLAVALGPMVTGIDGLIRRGDLASAPSGRVDGVDGLVRRGDLADVVLSEWALARVAPWEFLRRAGSGELLHLRRGHQDDRPHGQVAVLVDAGPAQLGASRLVQLATVIVLIGRAERRGAALRLGVLGSAPGSWATGRPDDVLEHWLRGRRVESPGAGEIDAAVQRWSADLDQAEEMWVLTGARTAAGLPGRRRVVTADECGWDARGATTVDVGLNGHRAELRVPRGAAAVRALREAVTRPDRDTLQTRDAVGGWTFTSAGPTLLALDHNPCVVTRLDVRPEAPARPKRLHFTGRVRTAAAIGRRVVALVELDGVLRVEVIGSALGRTTDIEVPAADLPASGDGGLMPLVYDRGTLLTSLGGRWYHLEPQRGAIPAEDVVAVRPGPAVDVPVVVRARTAGPATQLLVDGRSIDVRSLGGRVEGDPPGARPDVVIGGDGRVAWRADALTWRVGRAGTTTLERGETVLGLHEVDDAPALVVVTEAAGVVRLRWPAGSRTCTAWSGGAGRPSVHPTRPWIAVQRADGAVEVGDLRTGETLLRTARP